VTNLVEHIRAKLRFEPFLQHLLVDDPFANQELHIRAIP